MNTRLKQFIAAENITQAQLADTINVVRASVSHILAGRNKPSYEFISGLMRHYPDLNMEWLMFGKGKMYKNIQSEALAEADKEISDDLFADVMPVMQNTVETAMEGFTPAQEQNIQETKAPSPAPVPAPAPAPAPAVTISEIKALINTSQKPVNQRKLVKITAFFDDGTFQELTAN